MRTWLVVTPVIDWRPLQGISLPLPPWLAFLRHNSLKHQPSADCRIGFPPAGREITVSRCIRFGIFGVGWFINNCVKEKKTIDSKFSNKTLMAAALTTFISLKRCRLQIIKRRHDFTSVGSCTKDTGTPLQELITGDLLKKPGNILSTFTPGTSACSGLKRLETGCVKYLVLKVRNKAMRQNLVCVVFL